MAWNIFGQIIWKSAFFGIADHVSAAQSSWLVRWSKLRRKDTRPTAAVAGIASIEESSQQRKRKRGSRVSILRRVSTANFVAIARSKWFGSLTDLPLPPPPPRTKSRRLGLDSKHPRSERIVSTMLLPCRDGVSWSCVFQNQILNRPCVNPMGLNMYALGCWFGVRQQGREPCTMVSWRGLRYLHIRGDREKARESRGLALGAHQVVPGTTPQLHESNVRISDAFVFGLPVFRRPYRRPYRRPLRAVRTENPRSAFSPLSYSFAPSGGHGISLQCQSFMAGAAVSYQRKTS